ncbi:sporulation histidine kinase inhibitor Sda [Paenibacillus silviterrae]|uniref:sporulation histidine kinase inhibitor Sda n=1 Tax=Paenibacillus silviterrae TaxID=3242194 RepID=UPI0032B24FB9
MTATMSEKKGLSDLDEDLLIKAYRDAVRLKLHKDFISLLLEEIVRRNIELKSIRERR